jgi:hypothetical protein
VRLKTLCFFLSDPIEVGPQCKVVIKRTFQHSAMRTALPCDCLTNEWRIALENAVIWYAVNVLLRCMYAGDSNVSSLYTCFIVG